jgi:hypothetical protein
MRRFWSDFFEAGGWAGGGQNPPVTISIDVVAKSLF